MPQEKSAGAVVFYRSSAGKIEYLLLKHHERYWNFPKGGFEKGESEIEAAKREVFEETGLKDIKIIPGFKAFEKYFFYAGKNCEKPERRGKTIFKIVVFYLTQTQSKNVRISSEHKGYEWLDFEGAQKRLKRYKGSREVLSKANEFIAARKIWRP